MGFGHRQKNTVPAFHILVIKPKRFAKVGPCNLHPDQVIGMVDHPHLIGFGIADPNTGGIFRERCGHGF
jgi:hypothetical protein